ncbi:hypothetical protein [Chryseobacterium luquanense]|uniref:CRISPR-associated protein Cas2 n=1 Tax=Chryseobacterium luquanense TaxID=2983766 RepID=A0ABT3Y0D0_9FLAO|nr:hypothetical protein [Chryseobacterium luquanense]MCX8531572.1 hypothetical protein [Chryseobacterium luquanense]
MKRTYIVIYQLDSDGDENALIEYIKSYKTWARITDNSFAVTTIDIKAIQLRDDLLQFKGNNGRIFVVKSGVEAAWSNTRGKSEWFKKNM